MRRVSFEFGSVPRCEDVSSRGEEDEWRERFGWFEAKGGWELRARGGREGDKTYFVVPRGVSVK